MSLPVPTSPLAISLMKIRRMVSLSKEFQKKTGSDTARDAEKFIHFVSVNPSDHPRPHAIIWLESFEQVFISTGSLDDFGPGGVAAVQLTMDADPLLKFGESHAAIEAANFVGNVENDIVALSRADDSQDDSGHLGFNATDHQGPFRTPIEERNSVGDFYYSRIMFDFKFNR